MSDLRATPEDLIDDLRELAEISSTDSRRVAIVDGEFKLEKDLEAAESIEADAANFIEAATKFLRELIQEGGPHADRAKHILDRLE